MSESPAPYTAQQVEAIRQMVAVLAPDDSLGATLGVFHGKWLATLDQQAARLAAADALADAVNALLAAHDACESTDEQEMDVDLVIDAEETLIAALAAYRAAQRQEEE